MKQFFLVLALAVFLCPLLSFAAEKESKERSRVQKRLELIEGMLRKESASSPRLQAARLRNLDYLREYWMRGSFPKNIRHPGVRVPYFVDFENTPCAVGYLLLRSGKRELVDKVKNSSNHIYIDQIQDPEFLSWAENSGLSLTELELIQPTYEFIEKEREKERQKKTEEDGARELIYKEKGPEITILERVKKKIKDRSSDITGLPGTSDTSVHLIENKKNSPSTVTIGTNLRALSNEKYAIEWGDKKESMVPDCWAVTGCQIDNTFSHTYFVPGSYQVRIRKSTYDCKPEPNSRCETGDPVITHGPGIMVEAK